MFLEQTKTFCDNVRENGERNLDTTVWRGLLLYEPLRLFAVLGFYLFNFLFLTEGRYTAMRCPRVNPCRALQLGWFGKKETRGK